MDQISRNTRKQEIHVSTIEMMIGKFAVYLQAEYYITHILNYEKETVT